MPVNDLKGAVHTRHTKNIVELKQFCKQLLFHYLYYYLFREDNACTAIVEMETKETFTLIHFQTELLE